MPQTLTIHAGHVKIYGCEMCCEHCGQRELLANPQRITTLLLRMKDFVRLHRECPAPVGAAA